MSDKITVNLPKIKIDQAPAGLFSLVMSRLEREKKIRVVKRRLIVFGFLSIISLIVSVMVLQNLRLESSRSGFGQYLALLIYDFKAVVTNWQDFGLVLLETLPATGLVSLLTAVMLILFLSRFVARYVGALKELTGHQSY